MKTKDLLKKVAKGYTLQSMYAQIEYELQKQNIKPNMGLVILFTDPITNTRTAINY